MAARADVYASLTLTPDIMEEIVVVCGSHSIYDVDVCESVLAEMLDEVGVLGVWICHAHTLCQKSENKNLINRGTTS